MKNIFKGILMAAAVAVFGSMTSCTDDAHDDLLGIYAPPTDLTITSAQNVDMVKDGNLRTFTVAFSTQEGVNVNMKLVSNKYFLPSTTYTKAAGPAKNGNYAEGSTVNGSEVVDGGLVVIADGDNYTIGNSVLFTADGKAYRMSGKVTLVYEPDPEPVKLTQVLSVANNVPNGTNSVTIVLATAGVTATPNMWGGMEYGGTGNYLSVDFYSTDGTLAPGTYTAAASGTESEFNYTAGWDPGDLWGIGMVFENWGTCWWKVEDGVTSAEHLENGDITVELSGSTYTIRYNTNGIFFEYKGAIAGLGGDEDNTDYTKLQILSYADNTASGTNSVTLVLATDGVTATPNAWGGMDYTGTGNYLAIDFYSADGTLAPGVYTPAEEGVTGEFNYTPGWDPGDLWGIGMEFTNWGTCWWTVDNGNNSAVHITEGEILVEKDGDIYTITYNHDGLAVRFKGALDGSGAGDDTPDTPDVEYIEIANFLSSSIGTGLYTLQVGVDGITTTPNAWGGVDLNGEGNYLKIDFYSADGTLPEGTYTPAPNDALAEGNFSMGYDVDFFGMQMIWGTAWMTRAADGSETGLKIEDGTITVEKSGDNYIISLQSSAVNVRYTGPINL